MVSGFSGRQPCVQTGANPEISALPTEAETGDKSLVRTGCCLLSMLTSDAPRGSRSAAPGSSTNPSSLPFQVSRRAQFPS